MRNLPIILFMLFSMNLTAQPLPDIDKDDDGLIEVSDLETLNAMRYRLDGSGLKLNATAEAITTGCAVGGCKGYELTRDLDFNDIASYQNLANMKLWATGAGWQPIGTAEQPFTAIFKTNNSSIPNTIFNLKISRADESNVGLFGHIGNTAEISGIGLLDAKVEGHHQVGSLVGKNAGGQISNSYANGHVVGKGGAVGLLVGHSSGSITNSYANGEVSGEANGIGGLVGANHGQIANSYAMGSVVGSANNVGGLVGDNLQGTISNCYTTGSVAGSEDIGGLVGLSNLGTLISNYVSGKASGKRYIGGLVGSNIGGTITQSYWDKTASKLKNNTGGVGLLANELQSANAQDEDLKKPYYKWSTAHWDFGTAEQYPILKYATGSDLNNPVCGPEQTLPNCGTLLLGQHASLERILFLSDANLIPNFKPTELNYQLGITTGTKTLQLIPIASNPDSSINISRNGIVIDSDLASGTTSSVIILGENTEIVIEVSAANQRPAQYSLTTHYLQEITILGIPDRAIDEGEFIMLDASQNLAAADTLLSYRWTQSRGKTLFPSPDREGAILWLHIPEDYVPATAEHANLGLTLEINDGKTTLTKNITLTIAKVDNGNIPVAPPTLTILEGTAPEIDLDKDPDGSGKDFSYQWQSRAPGQDTEWIDINEATEKTHIISFLTESYTEYRVLINYTDGQGYKTIAASKAARYVPEIMILDSIKSLASEETIPADAKPQRIMPVVPTTPAFVCSTANIDQDDDGLIEICDLEGLNAIRYQLDGSGYNTSHSTRTKITAGCPEDGCKGYELRENLDFNDDASYSSTRNKVIWTEDDGWLPIGYYEYYWSANNKPFTAIFEGNDHTISNLMIDRSNTDGVGLFGYAAEGTINKVGLLDVDIQGASHVGGLVGRSRSSNITNSYATGAVEGGPSYVGGLVGSSYGGTITNSYATGDVEGQGEVGGLVGYSYYGTITNSYATSAVTGAEYYGDIGGLVGRSRSSNITNSYATGDVEGQGDIGGLVGRSRSSNITNSYATGDVEGDYLVGGLVGSNDDGTITNSYATGKVTGTGYYVGGLAGYSAGTITNSYATGAVEGVGDYFVGGLVGSNFAGTITNSYATGKVTGTGYDVGGLVGSNYGGTITNSYATGAVEGNGRVGGLVGSNDYYSDITNSYATGDVTGTGDDVGGLAGSNDDGTITNSYATGAVTGTGSYVGGLVGNNYRGTITNSGVKTTAALQGPTSAIGIYAQWSTANWDFGTSGQYPALKYAAGFDTDNPACGSVGQPACDTLLPGQGPLALLEQLAVSPGTLSPSSFDPKTHKYGVMVEYNVDSITLNTTATGATIHITRNTSDLEVNTTNTSSVTIPLTITTDTIITITVTEGEQRPTRYTITVSYNVPGNLAPPAVSATNNSNALEIVGGKVKEKMNEGQRIKLYSDDCTVDVECRLGFPDYPSLSLARNTLEFTIPVDFVESNRSTQNFVVIFAIRQGGDIASKETTFVVEKANNGSISIGQPTLVGSQLTAPEIDLSGDPDKGVQESSVRYKWWHGNNYIEGATSRTYTLGDVTGGEGHYVQISYTDGQGYCYGEGCTEKAINSEAIRGDIDVNDDGLIEIKYIDDLDAIRYVMDGSGYKRDMTATTSTVGCPASGCRGYELIRDLDFQNADSYRNGKIRSDLTKDKGWKPIGWKPAGNIESFSGIFKGNYHTISNLMINREGYDNIGLFSKIRKEASKAAKISRIHLHNINIIGAGNVGGLVGENDKGAIKNNSVTNSMVTGEEAYIGGLVGKNDEGTITNNSVTNGTVTGEVDYIGGLVGENDEGEIKNNSVTNGTVTGKHHIGGLVGANNEGTITNNSVTSGMVTGEADYIGGLAGSNSGSVSRSYASVNVSGTNTMMGTYVGGLVGKNIGQITDSYAVGDVSGISRIGGLVGGNADSNGSIKNSYATGIVQGTREAGGLIGLDDGTVTHSYWDKTTSGIGTSADDSGEGKTTTDLQSPTTSGRDSTEIYYGWSTDIWDFGTREQYPALKKNNGILLAGQRLGLQSLQISGNAVLIETFKNTEYSYRVLVGNDVETIQITPTAANDEAEITLSTSDNSDGNQQSFEINLAPGDSTITIVVNTNTREVTYILEVVRAEVQITNNSSMSLSEGAEIALSADTTISDPTILSDVSLVAWKWMEIDRLLATTKEIKFFSPADYVASDKLSAKMILRVEGTLNIGSGSVKSSAKVELTINKENNGDITGPLDVPPKLVEATTQTDLHLVAPSLSAYLDRVNKTDPDNGINENTITYQWQSRTSDSDSWSDIGRNEKTYKIPHTSSFNTQYRVKLGYTDGQDYTVPEEDRLVSQAITVKHVDRDNNGLIDILSADALDAIRHQLDGSGYKKSSTATEIITAGCPMNNEQQRQCRGYELKAHIDLSGGEDWEPIGNANEFNAIFEGNHYTISNLTINRSVAGKNIGFFGRTAETAKIRNVGLLNVNITADGNNRVGGLVGFNKGTIEGSYVVSSGIRGGSHVGALVGATSGGVIKNNYATVKSLSENNSSVCKLIGEINGSMIEGNKMIGPCENNKLFECPAP